MAHGYNNFMNNKDFHPANYTNQRRVSAEMYEWSHVVWLRETRSHASMQVRVSTAFIGPSSRQADESFNRDPLWIQKHTIEPEL